MTSETKHNLKTVSLLLADPSHAAKIAALHHILFKSSTSESEIAELLTDPGSLAFVATSDGAKRLVGYILGRVAGEDSEVLWIGVDAPWRRNGIGGLLIGGFERTARNVGTKRVIFEVAVDNEPALALYRKAGYTQAATRPNYYDRGNVQVDAAVLAKALEPPGADGKRAEARPG